MADLNNFSCTGRVIRDAQLKSAGGYELLEFNVAINGFKPKDTLFLKVNVWGKTATSIHQYVIKGKQVALSGTFKLSEWENRDGNTVKEYVLNCNSVTFCGSRKDEADDEAKDWKETVKDEDRDDIPF